MLEGREIVLLYGPPWAGAAQFSKHHLARYLARRGNRVLYVEAPLGPLTLLRRRRQALGELRTALSRPRRTPEGVWVRRHFNPVPYHSATPLTSGPAASRIGQRLLAPVLRRDLRRLGFRRPILVAGLPHAVDLVDLVPHHGLVYHCADDYVHVKGFPPSLPLLEEALCRRADFVVATAETLRDARAAWNPHTYWIPNGADVAHFQRSVEPAADVPRDGRPVVGFVGGIAQWVDVPLLAEVARQRLDWRLVLVGPVSTDVTALEGLPNVTLLGPRPYAEVPGYLKAMDVALIPFVQDQVTHNADPIKVYEYLAAGVPVVATDLPALRRLKQVVRLADDVPGFLAAVSAALRAGRDTGADERRAEAARHSWASRFEEFERLAAEHLPA